MIILWFGLESSGIDICWWTCVGSSLLRRRICEPSLRQDAFRFLRDVHFKVSASPLLEMVLAVFGDRIWTARDFLTLHFSILFPYLLPTESQHTSFGDLWLRLVGSSWDSMQYSVFRFLKNLVFIVIFTCICNYFRGLFSILFLNPLQIIISSPFLFYSRVFWDLLRANFF